MISGLITTTNFGAMCSIIQARKKEKEYKQQLLDSKKVKEYKQQLLEEKVCTPFCTRE